MLASAASTASSSKSKARRPWPSSVRTARWSSTRASSGRTRKPGKPDPSPRRRSRNEAARHSSPCTSSIPRRKPSTRTSGARTGSARRSSSWTSSSARWARTLRDRRRSRRDPAPGDPLHPGGGAPPPARFAARLSELEGREDELYEHVRTRVLDEESYERQLGRVREEQPNWQSAGVSVRRVGQILATQTEWGSFALAAKDSIVVRDQGTPTAWPGAQLGEVCRIGNDSFFPCASGLHCAVNESMK